MCAAKFRCHYITFHMKNEIKMHYVQSGIHTIYNEYIYTYIRVHTTAHKTTAGASTAWGFKLQANQVAQLWHVTKRILKKKTFHRLNFTSC